MSPKLTDQELREHTITHNRGNSWWISDVRGIPLSRVCEVCEKHVRARYKPEVLGEGEGRYEDVVEERIEPEDE